MSLSNEAEVLATIDSVAREVIGRHAAAVDREARFPRESLEALRAAGLLGLMSAAEVGGAGQGLRSAALAVERVARTCASTAMVLTMHYSAVAVLEKLAPLEARRSVAAGGRLATLAFSEVGSRSQFWIPVSTATRAGGGIRLDAQKSFVTSARHADLYVWSSRPVAAEGASTLWLVPRATGGVSATRPFEGLGLRGNDSAPVTAEAVVIPETSRLGEDGGGFKIMLEVVLPTFNVLAAAGSVGVMNAAVEETAAHAAVTRFEHAGTTIADLPTVRARIARMRVVTDMAGAILWDTIAALDSGRADAVLRVLECKAAAAEAALEVTEAALRVCGGAAFRRDLTVERAFRDAQASTLMSPTTDILYDFIGKLACGQPLF